MNTLIFLVFGLIIGNVVYVEGYRIKRNLNEYCELPEKLRAIGWICMEKSLPADEKEVFQTISSCFDKTSFDQVLNLFCGKTNQERNDLIMNHIHCFLHVDLEKFADGPSADREKTAECIKEAIFNHFE